MTTKENTRTIKVKCTLYIPVVVPNDPDLDWELCIEERGCPGTGRVGDAIKEYIEKCEKEGVCWGCPGRNEIMEAAECAPVQPASPPAPAEKEEEWWQPIANEMSEATFDDAAFYKERDAHISKIVAEAKRRGAEEAWKGAIENLRDEMRRIQDHTDNGFTKEQYAGFLVALNMLENRLNNPAEAGEK